MALDKTIFLLMWFYLYVSGAKVFSIDPPSGLLSTSTEITLIPGTLLRTFAVIATDSGTPSMSSSAIVNVNIISKIRGIK